MTSKPTDVDAERRSKIVWHDTSDGAVLAEHKQDVEPALEFAKMARGGGNTPGKEMRHAAIVPDIIVVKWLNELGVNFYRKDHWPAVRKLLNGEYKWLKTWEGKI